MINNMYMWVLDFEEGTVHKYEVTEVFWDNDYTHEDFLKENNHNASNCEWMLTPSGDYNGITDKIQQ
tara:strand:+ start:178 stop:378 length:201 start_codon:yes stop_codon:yes gene_type:complete